MGFTIVEIARGRKRGGFWYRCSCGKSGYFQLSEEAARVEGESHLEEHRVFRTFTLTVDATQAPRVRNALKHIRWIAYSEEAEA